MNVIQPLWDEEKQVSIIRWNDGSTSEYRPIGFEPYINRLGKEVGLRVWKTNCTQCGIEIFVKTSAQVSESESRFQRRNCDKHKSGRLFQD